MNRPLSDNERKTFEYVHDSDTSIGLVQTQFDGEETAVIAAFDEDEETGEVIMTPLAVLITEAMFARITPPSQPVRRASVGYPGGPMSGPPR